MKLLVMLVVALSVSCSEVPTAPSSDTDALTHRNERLGFYLVLSAAAVSDSWRLRPADHSPPEIEKFRSLGLKCVHEVFLDKPNPNGRGRMLYPLGTHGYARVEGSQPFSTRAFLRVYQLPPLLGGLDALVDSVRSLSHVVFRIQKDGLPGKELSVPNNNPGNPDSYVFPHAEGLIPQFIFWGNSHVYFLNSLHNVDFPDDTEIIRGVVSSFSAFAAAITSGI